MERARFERWAGSVGIGVERYGQQAVKAGEYVDPLTRIAWLAWEAGNHNGTHTGQSTLRREFKRLLEIYECDGRIYYRA